MDTTEQTQLDRIEAMLQELLQLRPVSHPRNEQVKIDLENQQRAEAAHLRAMKRRSSK